MNHVYILTDAEKRLVDRERELVKQHAEKKAQQDSCDHVWMFSAHCHNDTAYDCRKCGATKFE